MQEGRRRANCTGVPCRGTRRRRGGAQAGAPCPAACTNALVPHWHAACTSARRAVYVPQCSPPGSTSLAPTMGAANAKPQLLACGAGRGQAGWQGARRVEASGGAEVAQGGKADGGSVQLRRTPPAHTVLLLCAHHQPTSLPASHLPASHRTRAPPAAGWRHMPAVFPTTPFLA